MIRLSPEEGEHELHELDALLGNWYANRDTVNEHHKRWRVADMSIGREMIKRLIYGLKPDHRLQLTIGRNAVEGVWPRSGPHDNVVPEFEELAPGSALTLERGTLHHSFDLADEGALQFYVGNRVWVSLPQVAQNIREDGQLMIVEVELAIPVSSSRSR